MVAVEGGFKTKSGEIFNDLPDRIADPVILVCAGYAADLSLWGIELGWLAGLLAVMTAYVRVLGASTGAMQYFAGLMAKQHRMAIMTGGIIVAAIVTKWGYEGRVLSCTLLIICGGCLVTIVRRAVMIVRELESR